MNQPLRVMLDTNAYTTILDLQHASKYTNLVFLNKVVFYGFSIVRQELRAIPKTQRLNEQNYRILGLTYYDLLVRNHHLEKTKKMEELAESYLHEYDSGISKKKMWKDFLIVACASINNLDIVVTNDSHSMSSPIAQRAYSKINKKWEYSTPRFLTLQYFSEFVFPV